MKSLLTMTFFASSLLLAGCGDEQTLTGVPTVDPALAKSLSAETKVNFDMLTSPPTVPLPSFVAMDPIDGTLATDGTVGTPGYQTDTGNAQYALGKTDGWGVSTPISITFTGRNLAYAPNGAFVLIKTGDPLSPDFASTLPTELIPGQDYQLVAAGHALTVFLTKPLDPSSDYMFAVTDSLTDSDGNPVGTSNSYAYLKQDIRPPNEKLVPLQKITHAIEDTVAQTTGIDKQSIIYSSWFTTTSVGDVLQATKLASALAVSEGAGKVWHDDAVSQQIASAKLQEMFDIKVSDTADTASTPGVTYFTGTVNLPYFLDDSTAEAAQTTSWQSGMPSLAIISHYLANGTPSEKAELTQQISAKLIQIDSEKISLASFPEINTDPTVQLALIKALMGSTLTVNGKPIDSERLITRYSPVPKLKSIQKVPFLMAMSSEPGCQTPGSNDVIIYQHGITVSKETLKAIAPELTKNCHVVFAIDHPLHGQRGVGGKVTTFEDPALYLNLEHLTVARDNVRQSVIDILNLRASIGKAVESATQSPLTLIKKQAEYSFLGHSLGAIVGVDVANIANKETTSKDVDDLYHMTSFAFANPGADIPYLLLNSGSFGNTVKGGVAYGAGVLTCAPANIGGCFAQTQEDLINSGNTLQLAKMYGVFNQFAFAAQTVMDTVDPINHAGGINADTPVYLAMVEGDETIRTALA